MKKRARSTGRRYFQNLDSRAPITEEVKRFILDTPVQEFILYQNTFRRIERSEERGVVGEIPHFWNDRSNVHRRRGRPPKLTPAMEDEVRKLLKRFPNQSQRALAKRLGVSHRTLARWKNKLGFK